MAADGSLYQLDQKKSKAIVPKIIGLFLLGAIFYIGVLINVSLLRLTAKEETLGKLVGLFMVVAILILGIVLTFKHAKKQYLFFKDKIAFGKKDLPLSDVTNTTSKQNLWDKMFKTYHINAGHHFALRHISKETQVETYLQQLVAYAKRNSKS
jgi:hypothetical protein